MKVDEEMDLNIESKNKHINDLPPEILVQIFLSGLSVIDRLHCTRVSRHWKWAVGEFGWTQQRKIDRATVFEGIPDENIDAFSQRFWQNTTTEGACNLVSVLNRVTGPYNNLVELDLHSFGSLPLQPFISQIADTLPLFPKIEKLNIEDLDLARFVEFLPSSLRKLQISATAIISLETLEMLSVRCPNLVEVPFEQTDLITLDTVNAFLPRFPRQKTLSFDDYFESQRGNLTGIAGLKELEVLELWDFEGFDVDSFEAMTKSCRNLRKLAYFSTDRLTEESLFNLVGMSNLTVLEIEWDRNGVFTDSVLKAIAKRGQLKRFGADSEVLTDDSIVFLIDHCKSLVSLHFSRCGLITDRTLEAVVTEVHRRHGQPPRTHPTDPQDKGIFFFNCHETVIDMEKAHELVNGNPWLNLTFGLFDDDQREIV